jgi:hypothetical protein
MATAMTCDCEVVAMTFGQSQSDGQGLDDARHDAPWFRAIAYGIRAPNPHNTQAWRFQPLSDSEALHNPSGAAHV